MEWRNRMGKTRPANGRTLLKMYVRKTDGQRGQQRPAAATIHSMPCHSIIFFYNKKLMDSVYTNRPTDNYLLIFCSFCNIVGQDGMAGGTYTKRFFELDL